MKLSWFSKMAGIIYLYFLLFSIGFAVVLCNNSLWKRIEYTGKYLNLATSTSVVASPQKCAENCYCDLLCKSFGIHLQDMRCSLYDRRVLAGNDGTVEPDWFYYWALEDTCPVSLGYSLYNNTVCHKYYNTTRQWRDAQTQCQDDGGHLFLLDTEAKNTVLQAYQDQGLPDLIHLGATDEFEEDVWNWFNGVSINRTLFLPGRPDNFQDSQHCLALVNGELDDKKCTDHMEFICEMPMRP